MRQFSNLETYVELIKDFEHIHKTHPMPDGEHEYFHSRIVELKREYRSIIRKMSKKPASDIYDLPATNFESIHKWYNVQLPASIDTSNWQEMAEYLWDNYGTEIWADYSPTGQLFTSSFHFAILNKERGGDGHTLRVCETITRDV